MKGLRVVEVMLLIVGGALTGRAAYLHAKAELAGVLIRRAWEQSVDRGEFRRPWPWADTHPVARLRIPRIGYDEIVLEGATPRTLAFGPARMLSGPGLGEPGNLVMAGHRTSWFRSLEQIADGDTIEVEWYDARRGAVRARTYTVEEIRVVMPADVRLLEPTAGDALTLVTCYPFGRSPRSPQRFVVRAAPRGPSRLLDTHQAPPPIAVKANVVLLYLQKRYVPPSVMKGTCCVRRSPRWPAFAWRRHRLPKQMRQKKRRLRA